MQVIFLLRFTAAFLPSSQISGAGLMRFLPSAAAWGLATMYAYLVNGVHDAPEDRMNGNGRPISSGELSPLRGMYVARVLAVLALLIASVTESLALVLLVAAQLLCGHAYSAPRIALKVRTSTASLAVLLLGGLTFAAGWVSGGATEHPLPILLFGGAMTLWMACVGALVKDLSDLRGDAAVGRRTALILWGERRARIVCAATPLAIGLLYLLSSVTVAPSLLPSAFVLLAGAVATTYFVRTTSSDEPRNRSRLPYKAFMVTQYGACLTEIATELVQL
ncbi:UbiA family prenyltransferase [Streptomyces sp. NPDC050485]|uniref:UbiA family prenyltransferase n=1 Tax=Streptomyces sp. NPDC050485 TaxID=3365617 RepID=UPI0037A74C74